MNILCMFNFHKLEYSYDHPYTQAGYTVYECRRCKQAFVTEVDMGIHPIPSKEEALNEGKSQGHSKSQGHN